MDEGIAATIKRRLERASGLGQAVPADMLGLLREDFYGLFATERVAPWANENVLYVTEASLRRREGELTELTDVKMLANSRAIAAAAAHGDLSENSEWKFAIEEQRRLQAQAAKMRAEFAMARTIDPHDVPQDTVGIGSRVLLKRLSDGREVQMSFLGPWDIDIDNHVYSYKSQIAQNLMGKGVGETVSLKLDDIDGECRVERLGSALG